MTASSVKSSAFNPKAMNAFELITMCGGLDLTPMFDRNASKVKRLTRFHSKGPPALIMSRVGEELTKLGIDMKVLGHVIRMHA